jgi:hypothetical protein
MQVYGHSPKHNNANSGSSAYRPGDESVTALLGRNRRHRAREPVMNHGGDYTCLLTREPVTATLMTNIISQLIGASIGSLLFATD